MHSRLVECDGFAESDLLFFFVERESDPFILHLNKKIHFHGVPLAAFQTWYRSSASRLKAIKLTWAEPG